LQAVTILVGVGDAALGDSLRFSLELEGYAAKLCDEHSFLALVGANRPDCVVLDEHVFSRVTGASLSALRMPVVLLVGHRTPRLMARARAAGNIHVVESPLVDGVLLETIRKALDGRAQPGRNSVT
jgi:FixJ family two-component response regulator